MCFRCLVAESHLIRAINCSVRDDRCRILIPEVRISCAGYTVYCTQRECIIVQREIYYFDSCRKYLCVCVCVFVRMCAGKEQNVRVIGLLCLCFQSTNVIEASCFVADRHAPTWSSKLRVVRNVKLVAVCPEEVGRNCLCYDCVCVCWRSVTTLFR